MPSRRLSAVVTVVVLLALVVVAVAPAFATPAAGPAGTAGGLALHARLVGSAPADGSTVDTATQVALEFNEEVNPDFVAVRVAGPDGAEADGSPVVDGRTVTQALAAELPAGAHTVTYRVVSADGHPISGSLTFTTTAGPSVTTQPSDPASATPSPSTGDEASTAPSASPTPQGSSTPVSTEGSDGLSPWLIAAVAAVLAVLALTVGRRLRSRPAGGTGAAPEADDDAPVGDRGGAARG
ncbi:hypothetical protein GCM10023168_25200 [Fodinibacter luteus]|uniref:CopC domain-containing protein n=1 Tax=Fodinibacter luteus TaxID=552064 RepID=A0ABP8KJ08_9MICO